MTKQKVLVTGGAGYIGCVLVPSLLAKGFSVTVLDNFMYGQDGLLGCCHDSGLEIIAGDVRDESLMKSAMGKADIIIPLAAIVGAPACDRDPVSAQEVNLYQAETIMANLSESQKIVFPVTNSGYGIGEKDKECDENSPLNPVSLYGKTKVEAEKIIRRTSRSISLRLATVFGASPRMRTDLMVNDFVLRAVKERYIVLFESRFRRNFIHIRDVVGVILHGLEHFDAMQGEVYNVGLSSANLTKFELCEKIREQIPDLQIHENDFRQDPDKRDYIVSNAKVESTGWRPLFSLEDGIAELIRVYAFLRTNEHANI